MEIKFQIELDGVMHLMDREEAKELYKVLKDFFEPEKEIEKKVGLKPNEYIWNSSIPSQIQTRPSMSYYNRVVGDAARNLSDQIVKYTQECSTEDTSEDAETVREGRWF